MLHYVHDDFGGHDFEKFHGNLHLRTREVLRVKSDNGIWVLDYILRYNHIHVNQEEYDNIELFSQKISPDLIVDDSWLIIPTFKFDQEVCNERQHWVNRCKTYGRNKRRDVSQPVAFCTEVRFNLGLIDIDHENGNPTPGHYRRVHSKEYQTWNE